MISAILGPLTGGVRRAQKRQQHDNFEEESLNIFPLNQAPPKGLQAGQHNPRLIADAEATEGPFRSVQQMAGNPANLQSTVSMRVQLLRFADAGAN